MKFPIAYYLVLLYATVMLKPLIPIISDFWSHEFNEMEHISLIHAKYGSHHLEKELADTSSDSDHSKSQSTIKINDLVSFHIPYQECRYNSFLISNKTEYFLFEFNKLPLVFILNQAPPPKFS